MAEIAMIGTGHMGAPVAHRLLGAGHRLLVHDRRPEATGALADAGAKVCATAAEAVTSASMVFTCLPSHREVSEVLFVDGVLGEIRPGSYLIDLSTVSVHLVSQLAEQAKARGVRYLTAPVSQGVRNAWRGRLTMFIGGPHEDVWVCMPALRTFASTVIHTGGHTSAMAAKLATNWLWFVNAAAIGPALALGVSAGIDLTTLREVITQSCGTSWVAENDIPSIYDGSLDPTFTTQLCLKDLELIAELAGQVGVDLPLHPAVSGEFLQAAERYGAASPELSVAQVAADDAGVRFHRPVDEHLH